MSSPVGDLTLVACDGELSSIVFGADDATDAGSRRSVGDDSCRQVLTETERQLNEYFTGTRREFALPIRAVGTEFQKSVWAALMTIPYGATISYAQQAAVIGRPTATRAVGAANGRNPLPIVVPCHRVVGSNGTLTGFAGGVSIKQWLLDHERAVLSGRADAAVSQ